MKERGRGANNRSTACSPFGKISKSSGVFEGKRDRPRSTAVYSSGGDCLPVISRDIGREGGREGEGMREGGKEGEGGGDQHNRVRKGEEWEGAYSRRRDQNSVGIEKSAATQETLSACLARVAGTYSKHPQKIRAAPVLFIIVFLVVLFLFRTATLLVVCFLYYTEAFRKYPFYDPTILRRTPCALDVVISTAWNV